MRTLIVNDFDLRLTLESGQFFRYEALAEGYLLVTQGRAITVRQKGNLLAYDGADALFVRHLFGLTADSYAEQRKRLENDRLLAPLLARYPGLRIMEQDLHEATLGFICSSQSNIPKIRMNLNLLAATCGEHIDGKHHLPAPGTELAYNTVLAAKTGFRAKYLVATNKMLDKKLLRAIKDADYAASHELLCTLPGVGPKIADCICLFALGHGEAFPVDVHMIRAMKVLFPRLRHANEARIRSFAQRRWGKDAGLAQQFIFQWARDGLQRTSSEEKMEVTL